METTKEMLRGWWCHPDYFDQSVPGVAELLPNGQIRVELFDAFPEEVEPLANLKQDETAPVLWGRSSNITGNCLTLLNVEYSVFGPAAMGKSMVFAYAKGWIDRALLAKEKLKAYSATVDINGLRNWISGVGGETMELEYDEDGKPIEGSRTKVLENTAVELDDCVVHILIRSDGQYDYASNVDYQTSAVFEIVAHDRISLDRLNELAKALANFMSFVQGFAADIVEIAFRDVPFDEEDRMTWNRLYDYVDKWHLPMSEKLDSISIKEKLFNLRTVRDEFPLLLKNWIEKYDELHRVYDLYTSVQRAKFMYVEAEFLSHVRAIEGFHRWKCPDSDSRYIDQGIFEKWIESILEPFLEEHFKSGKREKKLRQNIIYNLRTMGNRYSLEEVLGKGSLMAEQRIM